MSNLLPVFCSRCAVSSCLILVALVASHVSAEEPQHTKHETPSPPDGLEWVDDFESGHYREGWEPLVCNDESITIVKDDIPAGHGKYCMRTRRVHEERGPGKRYCDVRAELLKRVVDSAKKYEESWVGVQLYVPESWDTSNRWSRVLQWHGVPDRHLGETNRNPPFALAARNEKWVIGIAFDTRKLTPVDEKNGGSRLFTVPMTRAEWTDWVFHWKWSYGDDGLFEAWQNGVQVATYRGPNTYNDDSGPAKWQMGNYHRDRSAPITTPLVIYHDNLKIGNQHSGYDAVAPSPRTNTSRAQFNSSDKH